MYLQKFEKLKATQDQFSELVHEEGHRFLYERFGDCDFCNIMLRSRTFWDWWKALWRSIDAELVPVTHNYISSQVYLAYHRRRKGQFFLTETMLREAKKEIKYEKAG